MAASRLACMRSAEYGSPLSVELKGILSLALLSVLIFSSERRNSIRKPSGVVGKVLILGLVSLTSLGSSLENGAWDRVVGLVDARVLLGFATFIFLVFPSLKGLFFLS